MSNKCELCQQAAPGTNQYTYYGFEVFICHDCKDTESYLEQIEGMTKCLCNHWFDHGALRTHLDKGECSTPTFIGIDTAKPGTEQNITFIHNLETTHAL